jgi:hypothetical protein
MKRLGMVGALAAVLLATGCTFDALTRDRFLSFDFMGTTVKVSSNGTENSLELKPYVAGSGSYEYTVLFSKRAEGFTYLLINAVSRSNADSSGPCADGREQNLIWLKLDEGFHLQDGKTILVESCLQNIHGPQGYDRQENHLTMNYVRTSVGGDGANFGSRQFESALTYDNDHPEAGPAVDTHEVK